MKIKFLSLIIIAATLFSCKTPEPRKPVSRSSGSFIKESIKRNQKLVAKEEKRISEIIQKLRNRIFFSYADSKGKDGGLDSGSSL